MSLVGTGGDETHRVEDVVVARVGSVLRCHGGNDAPWMLVDATGSAVGPVNRWLVDLHVSDYSPATVRAYAFDLLSWLRFLAAVEVSWTQATRVEVRDWVRWHQVRHNDQRQRGAATGKHRPAPGTVNPVTGKPYLAESYARSTVNHMLSAVNMFYEWALETDAGPIVNPVPKSRHQLARDTRITPVMGVEPPKRRAPYRQRVIRRTPRALSDDLFEELFSRLCSTRDKAIVATAVASGLRASELLSMQRGYLHTHNQTVEVVQKGSGGYRVPVPVAAPAFVWIARYLAQRPPGPPNEPVWMTVHGPPRPLTYWALRQVLERVNRSLGSNVTMHDFRHTFCTRLAEDENMTLADLQTLMRHASIETVLVYLRPQLGELVEKLQRHWDRPAKTATSRPAAGYDPDDLRVLFGGGG